MMEVMAVMDSENMMTTVMFVGVVLVMLVVCIWYDIHRSQKAKVWNVWNVFRSFGALPASLESKVNVGRMNTVGKSQRQRRKCVFVNDSQEKSMHPQVDDEVDFYGFHFIWSNEHDELFSLANKLRMVGDDAADAAAEEIAQIGLKPKLFALRDVAKSNPQGACASLVNEASKVPSWVDWKRIRNGQKFFLRHFIIAGYVVYEC